MIQGFRKPNYSGYLVRSRSRLLALLAEQGVIPSFGRVVAEHVTHAYPDSGSAPAVSEVSAVGLVTADGVEALIVEVDGSTVRPDGATYHLTLSLAPERKPFESNAAIRSAQESGTVQDLQPIGFEVDPF